MASLGNDHALMDQISGSVYDAATTTPKNQLGRRVKFSDGREFVYVASDADLAAGDVLTMSLNSEALTAAKITATAAGTNTVTLASTTGVALNEYAGGYLVITHANGKGYVYRIRSNTASNSGAVTVVLYDNIKVALTTSSVGVLINTLYEDMAQCGADGVALGVCVVPTTGATNSRIEYFWMQTKGVACVLRSGNIAVGDAIIPAASAAAKVDAHVSDQKFGVALLAETSSDLFVAYLMM